MNKAQESKLNKILKELPHFDFRSDNYEIKTLEVTEEDGYISVLLVTGLKGDEGTLAEIFSRKTRMFLIGNRGGISTIIRKKAYLFKLNHLNRLAHVDVFELLNSRYY